MHCSPYRLSCQRVRAFKNSVQWIHYELKCEMSVLRPRSRGFFLIFSLRRSETELRATTLWDPWGAFPTTLEIIWVNCILIPLQLLQLQLTVFARHCGEVPKAFLLPGFKGKRKGMDKKHQRSNNGRRGNGQTRKKKGSVTTPPKVTSNFSAAVAPTVAASTQRFWGVCI